MWLKNVRADNELLLREVINCRERSQLSNELASWLHTIARRTIEYKFCLVSVTLKEEMVGQAVLDLIRTWHHFNPEKSDNPYSFYFMCAYSSGLQVLNNERKECTVRELLILQEELHDEDPQEGCVPD